MLQFKLADGASADAVQWGDIGYADRVRASRSSSSTALQRDGTIAADVRFQMQYPTPLAPMAGTIVPEDLPAVTASYERALFADLQRALTDLPHERIAVQWDVAVEFGLLEANKRAGFGEWPRASLAELLPGLVRCIDEVPADVPVGMHLCYGDYGHQHFKQPESLALQVELVNAVVADARRPVNWFSFTVPQSRSDDAYFAPLEGLRVGPETELYFALVPYHPDDQTAGTADEQSRLIDAHLAASPAGARDWGICTECGMGRVDAGRRPEAARPPSRAAGGAGRLTAGRAQPRGRSAHPGRHPALTSAGALSRSRVDGRARRAAAAGRREHAVGLDLEVAVGEVLERQARHQRRVTVPGGQARDAAVERDRDPAGAPRPGHWPGSARPA